MNTIPELKGKTKYTNAEILAFHDSVLNYVNAATAPVLSCTPEIFEAYTKTVEALRTLVIRDTKSQQTEEVATGDDKRDADIVTLYGLVETYAGSPIEVMEAAGKPVLEAIRLYRNTAYSALAAETVEVKGLLKILKREDLQTHIAGIQHLGTLIADLEENNNYVENAMTERNAEETYKAMKKEKRAAAYNAYNVIALRANASMVLLPSDALSTFVTEVSNTIKRTEDVYNKRIGVKRANEEKEDSQE